MALRVERVEGVRSSERRWGGASARVLLVVRPGQVCRGGKTYSTSPAGRSEQSPPEPRLASLAVSGSPRPRPRPRLRLRPRPRPVQPDSRNSSGRVLLKTESNVTRTLTPYPSVLPTCTHPAHGPSYSQPAQPLLSARVSTREGFFSCLKLPSFTTPTAPHPTPPSAHAHPCRHYHYHYHYQLHPPRRGGPAACQKYDDGSRSQAGEGILSRELRAGKVFYTSFTKS